MKAYYYLSRKRMNKHGECPVFCRLATKNKRIDFSTGHSVTPDEWAYGWERIKRKFIGDRLVTALRKLERIIAECDEENVLTIEEVHFRWTEKTKVRTLSIDEVSQELKAHYNTTERASGAIDVVTEQFKASVPLLMNKVTPVHIRDFEAWVLKNNNSPWTLRKKLQILKRIFTFAHGKRYIQHNPFILHTMPKLPALLHIQVTGQEITALQKKMFGTTRLAHVRDLFLFQCYTGLSYGDLTLFNKATVEVRNGVNYLIGRRNKNKSPFMLPFLPEALQIAEKYNYRLPVLTNQKYNEYLKEIADLCEIHKRLTTHVGRKTFAQIMIDRGYSAESISLMLGHASFAMTQRHYARIGDARIESEVKRLSVAA